MKVLNLIAAAAALATGSAARAGDFADVRAVITAEIHMFARYDATMAPGIYASNVIWQSPFGVRFHSEADLQKFLARLFNRPGYRSGKDIGAPVITDVRLLASNVAVVWSEESSQGQVEDGKSLGLRKSHYLEVLRKRGGAWRVTDEMIMDEK